MASFFLQINPNQTLPALVDGDFSLGESRPAATYVAEYYDRVGNLYPKSVRIGETTCCIEKN